MLENLTQLGFTEKEAKVYLVLLRNGPALASTLAARTGLKRVTIYGILDALCLRGLVSYEGSHEGRRYLPHDPECLLYNLEREKAALQVKWDLTKSCIQSLAEPASVQILDARQVVFCKGSSEIQKCIEGYFDPFQNMHGIFSKNLSHKEKDFFMQLFDPTNRHYKSCFMLSSTTLFPWTQTFPNLEAIEHTAPPEKGSILVQGHKVFFLSEREDLELMLIHNAGYAKTVFEVLIQPYRATAKNQEYSRTVRPSLF